MSADDYPDYDLSFLDGTTGSDLAAVGKGLEDAAADLRSKSANIGENAAGVTPDRVLGELTDIRTTLESAAANAASCAAAFAAMKAAWDTWKQNAPRQAEIAAAEKDLAAARQALREADNHHAALYRPAVSAAEKRLNALIERREAADAALAAALADAVTKLADAGWGDRKEQAEGPTTPKTASPGAAAPSPKSQPPAAAPTPPSADTPLPGAATTPPPSTSPAAATSPSGGTPLSPAAAAALGAALAPAQPQAAAQPQQQAAMPQMPMTGMPTQPAQNRQDPRQERDESIADLLTRLADSPPAVGVPVAPLPVAAGGIGGGGGGGASVPAWSGAVTAPAVAPIVPASPALVAPQPAVTGTSISGLETKANVTGTPDGTPTKTGFSPPPGTPGAASHLSGGVAPGGPAPGTAGAAGAAGPAGSGMPMIPAGMPLGGGHGRPDADKRDGDPILDSEEAKLHALEAVARAVPGGTIAQRRDGS